MNILEELTKLFLPHRDCEDGWYRCPKHPDGCLNESEGTDCNCGAESHNAKLKEIIKELIKKGF